VRSRLASTIQPAPATFLWPVPTTRWYCPSAGVCLTRHHRGFIRIHPSALPQPVTPGWDEGPWALASGFAPRGCPRRTLRWGQALHTAWDPPFDIRRVSLVASTPLKRPHVASARGNSARPCYRAPAPDSGTASNDQGHIGVGGQPAPISRQHGVPRDTSTQVKIPGRDGKLPGTYQGRRGPRPLRGAVNGPGAVSCCPTSFVRVAQGQSHLPWIGGQRRAHPCSRGSHTTP
jgi:hypothetical protein